MDEPSASYIHMYGQKHFIYTYIQSGALLYVSLSVWDYLRVDDNFSLLSCSRDYKFPSSIFVVDQVVFLYIKEKYTILLMINMIMLE